MQFSVLMDEYPTENAINIKEREIHRWVKSDTVTSCYECKKDFWLYLRKHHCRSCGRVFCCDCTSNYIELPNGIENFPTEPKYWTKSIENVLLGKNTEKQRVCDCCYYRLTNIKKVENIVKQLDMWNIDVLDLYVFTKVNRSYRKASAHLLAQFREIQYKLPSRALTKMDKNMLWNNRYYLIGHSKWLLQLIKSVENDVSKQRKVCDLLNDNDNKISCNKLMCDKHCYNGLSAEDAIELLRYNNLNDDLKKYIVQSFTSLDEKEFLCYLPYFTYYLYDHPHLAQVIVDRSVKSIKIRTEFYWSAKVRGEYGNKEYFNGIIQYLVNKILKCHGINEVNKLLSTKESVEYIQNVNGKYNNCYFPLEPTICYDKVDVSNIVKMDSASKPIIVPVYYYNKKNKKVVHKILFKKESLLKDQIVVKIINLIDIILKRDENLDLEIIKYNVVPTSKTSGIIQVVDNACTIYNIIEKLKCSIQNYIIEHNKDETVKDIRNKFIKSTAAYCIISYLLGIGDRHSDNIMISESGKLFHIDFSYILGCDPKYASENIRITPEILDAMGGFNGKDYAVFQKLCTQIYNCLRKHIGLFMNLFMMIVEVDDRLTLEWLEQEMIKRFEPGENHVEAKLHLENKINKSRETYEYKVVDFMHKSFKENSIITGIVNATTKSSNFIYNMG